MKSMSNIDLNARTHTHTHPHTYTHTLTHARTHILIHAKIRTRADQSIDSCKIHRHQNTVFYGVLYTYKYSGHYVIVPNVTIPNVIVPNVTIPNVIVPTVTIPKYFRDIFGILT
jgi:hypothetical protein